MTIDDDIRAKYDAMPNLEKDDSDGLLESYMVAGLCLMILIIVAGIGAYHNIVQDTLASEIVELETAEFTCRELKIKADQIWINDAAPFTKGEIIYKRLVQQECVTQEEATRGLNSLYCKLYDTLQCKINEKMYPIERIYTPHGARSK